MENSKYYWIKTDGIVHKYEPILRNSSGHWVHKTLTTTNFISDYKLKILYGRDCIIKEVDFEKDVREWDEEDTTDVQQMSYFTVKSDNNKDMVLFGSRTIFYYHTASSWQVNRFGDSKVLVYKEDYL